MTKRQPLTQFVDTYRFWDVVSLWARDRLEHEDIVARALAQAVILDGLKVQSIDPRWVKGNDDHLEFKGYPYVAFRAKPDAPMCLLRADALEHLLSIVRKADVPSREQLTEEFISREDFRIWVNGKDIALPHFWFGTTVSSGLLPCRFRSLRSLKRPFRE
jgi:hypothetical protein